ncbi:NUDIX hydrolase [Thiomicrorhabdus indica]|uniref:NUDIX hydrolase n=1 Tax=Thiomicrorhabdus indica TaxID=2267253 RepID=UPI00102D6C0F|nr:NUDIX hydrolase [Thiomicrorhabdus indica]
MANQPDWLQQRSAAIPLIIDNDGIKVVLITTKPKKNDNWIFPKGQVELNMTAFDSAAKEAFEEAGVIGQINPVQFDEYQHKKWGGNMSVKVYTLEVSQILDQWPEMRDRHRQIVSLENAIDLVQSVQKNTLIKLKQKHFNTI